MSVEIIAVTQPSLSITAQTPEELLVYVARVSNPNNQDNHDTGAKLLAYCLKNKHWSVFETISITLGITTTRDIGRQLLRHRSFCFQEFSGRYAAYNKLEEHRACRMQDKTNRQHSTDDAPPDIQHRYQLAIDTLAKIAQYRYQELTSAGVAKECARALLPEGLTPTHLYMTGTLRSWLTYCAVRAFGPGVQQEHRDIAIDCWQNIAALFPTIATNENLVRQLGQPLETDGAIQQAPPPVPPAPTLK